jgi:2-dehydropantoate 2-reductase
VLSNQSPDGKTSMLQDVEAGRKTEVEMFAGKVIELGKCLDIPTPVNEILFQTILALEGPR